jgi:pilus assembly protein Flp/PilA
VKRFLHRFGADARGATAIEYGLIAALIFLVIIGAMTLFGETATTVFSVATNAISDVIGG